MNPTVRAIEQLLENALGSNRLNIVIAVNIYNWLITHGWTKNAEDTNG